MSAFLSDVQSTYVAQTTTEQKQFCTATSTEKSKTETTQARDVIDMVPASWLTQESRSAPELTSINLKEHNELTESCSDSYTSTCTTTATTSDEYQRMYNAQSALQTQIYYDLSSTDLNSSNCDYEVVSIQQQQGSFSSGSTDLIVLSGRRSTQECSDSICNTINTCQLVDYIKANPEGGDFVSSVQPKLQKRVGFSENITRVETDTLINSGSQPSSIADEQGDQTNQSDQTEAVEEPPIQSDPPPEVKTMLTSTTSVVYNQTPKEWSSLMCQALTTASDKPFHITDLPEAVVESSTYMESSQQSSTVVEVEKQAINITKADDEEELDREVESVLSDKTDDELKSADLDKKGTSFLTTDPADSMEWFKPVYENVPLPDETTPYFPPNIPLLPVEKHEPLQRKSPFVEALTVAPLRPFTPFENDVISQIEGLPRPPTEITLVDALTTAPSEPITKLNPDLPDETEAERVARLEKEKRDIEAAEVRAMISKTVDTELSKKCTTFAPLKGYRRVDPFNPIPSSYSQSPHNQSRTSSMCAENVDKSKQTTDSVDQTQTKNKACHYTKDTNRNIKKTTAFPPPPGTSVKSYVQSGLHSPKTIPKYQRQWFNLASQSPIRTPEPAELKENVPLAFVDVPHEQTDSISKPIAVTVSASASETAIATATTECTEVVDVKSTAAEAIKTSECLYTVVPTIVPTLPDNRAGPITMTFQTIEPKDIIQPIRSITPSLINRPAPMVPYYQQNLVYDYYSAPDSHTLDPSCRNSPRPDAMKPFAQGPPPSVLKIQAPRITSPVSIGLSTSIGVPSIVTGQSGAQVLASSGSGYQAASQSYVTKPEVFHREQKGGLSIQTHTTGSELNEAKKSGMETSSTVQIGNMQVQRNRRVVEEFEHTQKSSTTEIHTSNTNANQFQKQVTSGSALSGCQTELPYGRGFVARQARRLSEAPLPSKNIVASYHFPQTHIDYTESGFPLTVPECKSHESNGPCEKPCEKPCQKPCQKPCEKPCQRPCQKPCERPCESPCARPCQITAPKIIAPPKAQSPPNPTYPQRLASPQRTISPRAWSPKPPTPKPAQKISFPPPIDVAAYDTQFSSATAPSLTQQYQSSAITSAYQSLTSAGPSAFLPNPNYGSTSIPTPSTSVPGSTPPILTTTNYNKHRNTVSVSDPTPASAGPSNKSMSKIGATSAPKRGRGVLNASVAPGGRIPKCGCCGAQIR